MFTLVAERLARRDAFLLLAALLAPLPARAADDPAAIFQAEWDRLPNRAGWSLQVSPPFPARWPPARRGERTALIRYAFAVRPAPGIADGADVARPWARSIEAPEGGTVTEVLEHRLEPAGRQGVRPMRAAETALLGEEGRAATLLRDGDATGDDLVRAVTCSWIGRQGTVAATITPRHQAFTRWLSCRP